jgi:integrase
MAAPMVKTRHPGIYKRGSRYIVRFRANGKRHAESCRTLDEALQIKRAREAARDRGELDLVTQARTPLRDYAAEWIERYQGNGRRGFTDDTRHEYRRDLARYVYPFLGDRRLGSIAPRDVAEWIAWLCDEQTQGRRAADEKAREAQRPGKPVKGRESGAVHLSDATVRRIVSPLRACLATARREGLIRSNPCDGVPLPHRPQIEEADQPERAKALTREQLAMFLRIVPNEWRLLFEVLVATGLRWSELAALRWGDLTLTGSEPHLRVRRALAKRQPKGAPRFKPPKSRHGLRSIPLDVALCRELRQRKSKSNASDDDLVFPARNGAPLRQENVRRRILAVAAEEAGVPWIGFHTFRHTCASLLFAAGRNVKQVQRWLGHHSPGFTLDTYVHLLDDGVGGGLDLAAELAQGESKVRPDQSVEGGTSREPALVGTGS